jgi:hypothetical protein
MDILIIVAIILFTAIVLTFIIIYFFNESFRTKKLKSFAKSRGYAFQENPQADHIGKFELFKLGVNKDIKNILVGLKEEFEIIVFDYTFMHPKDKIKIKHSQTLFIAKLSGKIPKFKLGVKHFYNEATDDPGYISINLSAYPKFSKNYDLKAVSEEDARTLFNPSVIYYFEKKSKCVNIETYGDKILIYNLNDKVPLMMLDNFINDCIEISNLFNEIEF